MYALITGSRFFNDYDQFTGILDNILEFGDIIVSGGGGQTDAMAERYARQNLGTIPQVFKADWRGLGKIAGPIRNQRMVGELLRKEQDGEEVLCIAFLMEGKENKGTRDTMKKARECDIPVAFYWVK